MSNINPLLNLGDHLIAQRIGYTHHGLYLGEGKVLEYLLQEGVNIVDLEQFANGKEIYIREHKHARYPGFKAVQRGMMRCGEKNYNLLTRNCEHFVNWCIDGVESSRQVDNLILTIIPFYSIFQKSNFLKGCLKVVFDDPNSLDIALARINANEKRAQDPIVRAKELSEDILGTDSKKVVSIASLLTTASQLSSEYNQWAGQKIIGTNNLIHRSLEQAKRAIDHINNKLGVNFYTNDFNESSFSANDPKALQNIKDILHVVKQVKTLISSSHEKITPHSQANDKHHYRSYDYPSASTIIKEVMRQIDKESMSHRSENTSCCHHGFANASEYFQRSISQPHAPSNNKQDQFTDLEPNNGLPPSWKLKLPKIHIVLDPEMFAHAMTKLDNNSLDSALARHAHSTQYSNHQSHKDTQNSTYSLNDMAIDLISELTKELNKKL